MSMRKALVFVGIALLLGCSPKEPISSDPWMEDPQSEYTEEADTLTYDFLAEAEPEGSETVPAEPDLPVLQEESARTESEYSPAVEDTAPPIEAVPVAPRSLDPEEGPLFWVQIFASGSRDSAEEYALKADDQLDERVRILYLDPHYKVLVGGFPQRESAVELRRELVERGYEGAWIFEK